MLKVMVKRATNLLNVDTRLAGKSDPYAVISFQGLEYETDVIKDELCPVWNKEFTFDLNGRPLSPADELTIKIKDWEKILFHRVIGSVTIPLGSLIKGKSRNQNKELDLLDGSQRPIAGKLQLSLYYEQPPDPTGNDVVGQDEETDESEEESGTKRKGAAVPDGKRKKKRKRQKIKHLSDKLQDFQIRVKVLEARQLPGGNIHPAVRVSVSNQEQQTKAKKATHRPSFDQSFSFMFHSSPADLFDDLICFEVFDVRRFRKDALIGYFEIGIGEVYDRKGHSLIRKWMLLTNPRDKHQDEQQDGKPKGVRGVQRGGDPAGYLKATVSVLGPKDKPPTAKRLEGEDDTDDIESNLLRPCGVTLQPVVFSLKVFLAEDLPQMDSSAGQGIKKFFGFHKTGDKFVDPYVVLSFAGKQVQTAIKYKTDNPKFQQVLRIPAQFPSMCDCLKLQIFDWDRWTNADCIATATISLTDISGRGTQGFLPQLGPCFLNFYGSPREYSELLDEYNELNYGKGEGVAYRGRVMVELETSVTEGVDEEVEDIDPQDVIRLQPYMSRTKYKLFACFYEASMVADINGPIEFEVSIGNYGNTMDESVAPSNTPPCNSVHDGCYYHYLPWGGDKPCVCVESYWEDMAFRLEPLNVICSIIERLESNIRGVRCMITEAHSTDTADAAVLALLDQLIADCGQEVPNLKGRSNKLDRKIRKERVDELAFVLEQACSLYNERPRDMKKMLIKIEEMLQTLKDVAIEPQNCIPDIIIWMISGNTRIAYHRIPAHEVFYSTNTDACGKYCKKTIELLMKYPGKKGNDFKSYPELPAVVRLALWLGREEFQGDWTERQQTGGEFCIFAETYENEVNVAGIWTKELLLRPPFSNASGDIPLPKDNFQPPCGWKFEGRWFKNPELSLTYEPDSGHTSYLEDMFENESRMWPGEEWGQASVRWSNVHGDEVCSPEATACPNGWMWSSMWQVDRNRAVDDEGWEYSVGASYGAYGPIQKSYHLVRKRRWVINRILTDPQVTVKQAECKEFVKQDWEYAMTFSSKFHAKKRSMDFVRRRRWHKKLVSEGGTEGHITLPPVLQLNMEGEDDEKACIRNIPRMFVSFKTPHKFQLWVYLYQARDMISMDESGMNDCYVRVAFGNQSQSTEILSQTLSPCWDQTLIFENVEISESLKNIAHFPPTVFLEFFDRDSVGRDDFLGRCSLQPIVRLEGYELPEPELGWNKITRGQQDLGGEILANSELFLDEGAELPFSPLKRENGVYGVPCGVRPETQRTAVEILCWGVRNMQKFQLTNVTSPYVEFECCGKTLTSDVISDTRENPNFDQPLLPRMFLNLPVKELYTPPMNIRVRDNRSFGRRPIVGVHSIKTLATFKHPTPKQTNPERAAKKVPVGSNQSSISSGESSFAVNLSDATKCGQDKDVSEMDVDWWSKFYASIGDNDKAGPYLDVGYQTFTVYDTELERVDEFQGFNDFILTFPIHRGKNKDDEDDSVVGEFKGTFRVYPLPPDERNMALPDTVYSALPPSQPVNCLIRVYIVKALELPPQDPNGKVDSYLVLSLGNERIDDEDNYVANNLNPDYGRMFEFSAKIPLAKDLKVTVKDRDVLGRDDFIGETVIDLEQRLLSRYRATCGLPKDYYRSGLNRWRDCQKPREILEQWCAENNKAFRFYGRNTLVVDGKTYSVEDIADSRSVRHNHHGNTEQRLALHALNQLPLVPEHVETRPLYSALQPHFEQGKLQMWVDIFPKHLGTAGSPTRITTRQPKNYVARVVVWNTADVNPQDTSFTGEKMSDIYVKGWLDGIDKSQDTEVHYRSMDGVGNFNWRFVFPFLYLPHDRKLVVMEKEHLFSIDETVYKLTPTLVIQIWDNDILGDDYIGSAEFNLTKLPKPAKNSKRCRIGGSSLEYIDLFNTKSAYGWWPLLSNKSDLAGKIELTIEVLSEEEELLRPAGQGRDDPNKNPALDQPQRPPMSFLWFTSPFRSFKYIIWRNYKWTMLGILFLLIVIIFLVLFMYSVPGFTVKKLLRA